MRLEQLKTSKRQNLNIVLYMLSLWQVGKNHGLRQVLSLPEHKSPVVSVDWSSLQSCYTCLTGSVDGTIQVTSLLKP